MSNPRVILKPKRAQPFFARHPWVFPGAVQAIEGDPTDGAEVDLVSSADNFIARGFFNSKSKIRVRLYSWDADQSLDEQFFRERIAASVRLRNFLFGPRSELEAYRLVASEADGISGMIVDRYSKWLVMQITSLALAQRRDMIGRILAELPKVEGIYLRTERGIGKLEGLELQDGLLLGTVPTEPITINESGVRYYVDLREGQKTGFFLDQRANRKTASAYLHARDVLDCFCYTGGFGLHAAKSGARSVESVDISETALTLARRNADLNDARNITFVKADVFHHLRNLAESGRKFGAIILDPPKFARSKHAIPEALRGYRTLMSYAMRLLESEGILIMCCCSGLITATEIEAVMGQVAAESRREIQILERRGQDVDHPIALSCPQTSYLKCFICRVI